MNREDIIKMAREAGFEIEQPSDGHNVSGDNACLERFAVLVAAEAEIAWAEYIDADARARFASVQADAAAAVAASLRDVAKTLSEQARLAQLAADAEAEKAAEKWREEE